MAKPEQPPPGNNGKALPEQTEKQLRREIRILEQHLHENGINSAVAPPAQEMLITVPSGLEHLKQNELGLYMKLPKKRKESYLAHIAKVRAEEAEGKGKEKEQQKVRKTTTKPEASSVTKSKKPKIVSPGPEQPQPTLEISPTPAIEAGAEPDGRIESEVSLESTPDVDTSGIAKLGEARAETQKDMDKLSHVSEPPSGPEASESIVPLENIEQNNTAERGAAPIGKERIGIPIAEVENIVREMLSKKAEIAGLTITETPEGLQVHAKLLHGMAGKIELDGIIVNDVSTIGIQGLEIKAQRFEKKVKAEINSGLFGLDASIKTYFEEQSGKPISSIQVGESGLVIEFEPPRPDTEAVAEPDGRKETDELIIPDPAKALNPKHVQEVLGSVGSTEKTPAEWRKELKELITSEGEAELLGVGKISERLRAHMAERSKELDTEIKEKCGQKIAEFVNAKLDAYNKLHWSKKLFITGGLVAGVSLTSAVAPIISGMFATALYGQRVVGGAGLLKSQRGKLDTYAWSKDKSALFKNTLSVIMAGVWAGGTMYAVNEAVEKLNELGVDEWISNMFGNQVTTETPISAPDAVSSTTTTTEAPTTTTTTVPEVPVATVTPEPTILPSSAPSAVSGEAIVAQTPSPEMPDISVGASQGHGYEYMAKQLWEELQKKGLDASNYAEGSDIRRLLEADASSIDTIVHQIALDPEHGGHGFYNADGTSVLVTPDSHMTIDTDGNVRLNDMLNAPENAPTTPVYPPEVPEQVGVAPAPQVETQAEVTQSTEPPTPVVEQYTAPDQYIEQPQRAGESGIVHDESGAPVIDSHGEPVQTDVESQTPGVEHAPAQNSVEQATQPEVSNVSTPETQTFFTKIDNVQINPKAPGIYEAQDALTGEKYIVAFGGSDAARINLIQDYLMHPENQGQSIRFAHEVPSIIGSHIKVDEIGAGTTGERPSWSLNFFKKPIPLPSPDTFLRQLSK